MGFRAVLCSFGWSSFYITNYWPVLSDDIINWTACRSCPDPLINWWFWGCKGPVTPSETPWYIKTIQFLLQGFSGRPDITSVQQSQQDIHVAYSWSVELSVVDVVCGTYAELDSRAPDALDTLVISAQPQNFGRLVPQGCVTHGHGTLLVVVWIFSLKFPVSAPKP